MLLLALLFLGLLVPVMYANRVREHELAKQTRVAEMKDASCTLVSKGSNISVNTRSEAEAKVNAASGKTPGKESPPKPAPQQQPSKETAATQTPAASGEATVVGIAVIGRDGELLYGPAEVKVAKENTWGITALGALDATGLPYTISTRYTDFVDSIAGQRNRGQAGWMYSVNGEIPAVAAAKKPVKQGDKVVWWYSKSIDQTPPSWEQLVKHR